MGTSFVKKISFPENENKIRSMLKDAEEMAKKHGFVLITMPEHQNIVLSSENDLTNLDFILWMCSIETPKITKDMTKWNHDKISKHLEKKFIARDFENQYTLDEMVPRVYEWLNHHIIKYGVLDNHNYEKKIFSASIDVYNLTNLYDKPFVLGYRKNELTVAPLSYISEFVAPLSYIITTIGTCWSVSEMHSGKLSDGAPMTKEFYDKVFNAIFSKEKKYDKFLTEHDQCITKLQSAFEDGAKMSNFFGEPISIGLVRDESNGKYHDVIKASENTWRMDALIKIQPDEFLQDGKLLVDKIKSASENAFQVFSKRHKIRQITKLYDAPDLWTKEKIRDVLKDAQATCEKYNQSFCIKYTKNNDLILCPNLSGVNIDMFVCGVTPKKILDHWEERFNKEEIKAMLEKKFWDLVEYVSYTLDDMVPRMYDVLVNNIVEYGSLGFLSEGRAQLDHAHKNAIHMVKKHNKPFILGKIGKCITIAPLSEISRFIAPLSVIVTRNGNWSVSEIHSTKYRKAPVHILYVAMAYNQKSYGKFVKDKDMCIIKLENAFEDAVKLPTHHGLNYVILNGYDEIITGPKDGFHFNPNGHQLLVDPKEFLDGKILLHDKIRTAANDAYEKFSKYRNTRSKSRND